LFLPGVGRRSRLYDIQDLPAAIVVLTGPETILSVVAVICIQMHTKGGATGITVAVQNLELSLDVAHILILAEVQEISTVFVG
jgi:hypothetical protein